MKMLASASDNQQKPKAMRNKFASYIDPEIHKELQQLSAQAGITISQALNDALRAYMPILRRLADVRSAALEDAA